MATWTGTGAGQGLSDEALEPNKPWTSAKALAVRDNPIALAEGASGAPKISNDAFDDDTIGAERFQEGNTERDWVLDRIASASVGVVGTYAMLSRGMGANEQYATPGDTKPGSDLFYHAATVDTTQNTSLRESASSPSGTWQCHGILETELGTSGRGATLWLRIA